MFGLKHDCLDNFGLKLKLCPKCSAELFSGK